MKRALITGITGQTGSYLAEYLLELGYEVHGIIRRSSTFNTERIDHLMNNQNLFNKTFFLHYGDITDSLNVSQLVAKIQPDEIYNLAAQSHVKVSFEIPQYTSQVDAIGTLNVLEATRNHCFKAKIYQASTSELFGGQQHEMPITGFTEDSIFHPRSPYGCAKLYGYWITKNYREAYNMFACNGILFNHESPRRGETFITKKITTWCAKNYQQIKNNMPVRPAYINTLKVGNLNASRDWGHATDYCKAMHSILQYPTPEDFIIATGETHTVREFIEKCFVWMGEKISWEGTGDKEIGKCNDITVIEIDPKYYRPSEVDILLGNPSKAKEKLGWSPTYTFTSLIDDMMEHDFIKEGLI